MEITKPFSPFREFFYVLFFSRSPSVFLPTQETELSLSFKVSCLTHSFAFLNERDSKIRRASKGNLSLPPLLLSLEGKLGFEFRRFIVKKSDCSSLILMSFDREKFDSCDFSEEI
jgi:hypothetical protein